MLFTLANPREVAEFLLHARAFSGEPVVVTFCMAGSSFWSSAAVVSCNTLAR